MLPQLPSALNPDFAPDFAETSNSADSCSLPEESVDHHCQICPTCGQSRLAEAEPTDSKPADPFRALLTEDEVTRGVRWLHELAPDRQQAVRVALGEKRR